MTREEAIEVLENGEWWEELTEWYMIVHPEHDKLHDAVDMAISALRQQDHFRDLTKKVDAVPVVRCRECKHLGFCGDATNLEVMGFYGYCSRGERKEGADNDT